MVWLIKLCDMSKDHPAKEHFMIMHRQSQALHFFMQVTLLTNIFSSKQHCKQVIQYSDLL